MRLNVFNIRSEIWWWAKFSDFYHYTARYILYSATSYLKLETGLKNLKYIIGQLMVSNNYTEFT